MTGVAAAVATPAPAGGANPPASGSITLGGLYDKYGSTAYNLALTITCDAAAAEHVVTAAFAKTWREFAPEVEAVRAGDFFARLISSVRARAVAARKATAGAVTFSAPRESQSQKSLAVAHALRDLPDAQQEILALAYFGGLRVADIAARLQQPVSHIKLNLQAALGHLRTLVTNPPRGTAL